jgi:ATP-dependent Clp protease protease subunit
LLKDIIIFIGTQIDDFLSNAIVAHLLLLQMKDPKKDSHICVNSPGGSITSEIAICDTMQFVRCDIVTYYIGQAAGMGTILLTARTKRKRFTLPNSRTMTRQPTGDASG